MEPVMLRYQFDEPIDPLSYDESELAIHFAIEHRNQIMVKDVELREDYVDTLYVIIRYDISEETLLQETQETVADKLDVRIDDAVVQSKIAN